MRKNTCLIIALLPVWMIIASSVCSAQDIAPDYKPLKNKALTYKDGNYEGKSRSKYVGEPFWGIVNITVKDGSVTDINYIIRDSSHHETFNENYEKHFDSIPEYIQQCRNDWKGVQLYPKRFSETGDLDKIDAITGATWSYNIFKASAKNALKYAELKRDTVTIPDTTKF